MEADGGEFHLDHPAAGPATNIRLDGNHLQGGLREGRLLGGDREGGGQCFGIDSREFADAEGDPPDHPGARFAREVCHLFHQRLGDR